MILPGNLRQSYLYDAHVQATDNEIAKKVIADIRDEEKAHVGELMALLRISRSGRDPKHFAEGESEVREMIENLGIEVPKLQHEANETLPLPTVGSLINK